MLSQFYHHTLWGLSFSRTFVYILFSIWRVYNCFYLYRIIEVYQYIYIVDGWHHDNTRTLGWPMSFWLNFWHWTGAEPANRWKAGHDAAEGLEHVWEAQDLITWCNMSIAHVLWCYVYSRMYVHWSIPHIHPPTKTKKTQQPRRPVRKVVKMVLSMQRWALVREPM